MKKKDLKKAADLLKNDLTPEEESEIMRDLEKEGLTREEIESLRVLNDDLNSVFSREPREGMDNRFYSMLKEESRIPGASDNRSIRNVTFRNTWMLAAAGIALFILGWLSASWFGISSSRDNQLAGLSGELRELKETLVLTMLEQSSTVERIKAVSMVTEFETADTRIIENLLKVLETDNNDNVRLLALEALVRYAGNEDVRKGLVESISKQTSPMIQLRMAEIMMTLNEKKAVDEFRKLLDDANLNYNVRLRMQEAVGTLL